MPAVETGLIENIRLKTCEAVLQDFDFSISLLSEYDNFKDFQKKSRVYLSSDKVLLQRLCNIYISELVREVNSGKVQLEIAVSEMLDIYNRYAHLENLRRKIPGWIFDLYIVNENLDGLYELFKREKMDFPLRNDFLIYEYLKVFFSSSQGNIMERLFEFLPSVCSYKYYEMPHFIENSDICRRVISKALEELFEVVFAQREKEFFIPGKKKILRSAFDGLYCACDEFRLYEIEYIPYSESEELNNLICCAVKYTDNILRQSFGVRSKLMGIGLEKEYRTIICDIIREKFPFLNVTTGRVGRKPKPKSDGEDSEKSRREIIENNRKRTQEFVMSVDFSRAKALERESWEIAEFFGSDYEGTMIECSIGEKQTIEKTEKAVDIPKDKNQDITETYDYGDFTELFENLTSVELGFLKCLSKAGDINAYCKGCGKLPLGISSEINEKSLEYFGDVIIGDNRSSLYLLPDYEREISEITDRTDK